MSLASLATRLPAQHREALEWFHTRTSQFVRWPEPIRGLFLANKAKGIHKPAGWKHALSIRLALGGPYLDTHHTAKDGDWSLDYSQEGDDPNYFTNRALVACMDDGVPVAVLKQTRDTPHSEYVVLGLGYVTRFSQAKFLIRSISSAVEFSEARLLLSEFDALNPIDTRAERQRMIAVRVGQPDFRDRLVQAYSGRCAISGCAVPSALQAAHILCYRGAHTNHIQNGILLRADIHSLFDAGLISIDPHYRISVHSTLNDSEYFRFHGKQIERPVDPELWSHPEALKRRLDELNSTQQA